MSSQPLRLAGRIAPARAKKIAPADTRAQRIARVLIRYNRSVQPALRKLAARHSYLADLIISFPALAVALSCPRRGFCPEAAIAAAVAGLPLLELAELADVPPWLRKLPPEAFAGSLPELPRDAEFARRILNHLPQRPARACPWLEAVALAAEWADADFALWIARAFAAAKQPGKEIDHRQLRRLALWAFFSGQPGTRAASLIEQPFNPAMGLKAARTAADTWIDAVDLVLNLGERICGWPLAGWAASTSCR